MQDGRDLHFADRRRNAASACERVRPSRVPGLRFGPILRLTWRPPA
jgi:hypothetical protein